VTDNTQTARARRVAARTHGGADIPASLSGMLASLGLLTFLAALIAAGANRLAYQLNTIDVGGEVLELSLAGAVVALIVVFVAFLFGGWVTGRMSRFDGAVNGMGAGLWLLLLAAVFALLAGLAGAEYNAFGSVGLPDWYSAIRRDVRTADALVLMVLFAVAVLAGGYLGGRIGENFNRRVDDDVVHGAPADVR
jgi:MFS family permease